MRSIDTDARFVYNENGLRIQKTVNGVVTKYTLHGKNIVHMTSGADELHIFYDAQNRPAVVVYNGMAYAYVKNLQGDIVAILDENGNTVVSYGYDAWGAPLWCTGELAETLGKVQPFRYRGYVFDEETGLYYLRSRYYNPRWGRFVNADALYMNNMYAYCYNNSVCRFDPSGYESVYSQAQAYGDQAALMRLHDYRSKIVTYLYTSRDDEVTFSNMTDMQLYDILVNKVAATMTYSAHPSMAIPNNTSEMQMLQEIVVYSREYFQSGQYYALDIANACRTRYQEETGNEFPVSADKIALEIRLHYNVYTMQRIGSSRARALLRPTIAPTSAWFCR